MATTTAPAKTIRVALIGNPNTGKSTLFTALAGVRQRVGNYPGVTVEKKLGHLRYDDCTLELIDLPGTYSIAPRSPDEMVTVDVLLGRAGEEPPDVVLSIIDASNLERNLFLLSQVLSLGRPTVVALNMTDVAAAHNVEVKVEALSERLGVPVVAVQAHRRQGIEHLKAALLQAAGQPDRTPADPFPAEFRQTVDELETTLNHSRTRPLSYYLVERLLLDSEGYLERHLLDGASTEGAAKLYAAREKLREAGMPVPAVEAIARYDWAAKVLDGIMTRPRERQVLESDRIDAVLTHWLAGPAVFLAVMALVFSSIFQFATPLMDLVDAGVGMVADAATAILPAGALQSLVVDGVIGGIGAVVIFLPQILILFAFIAILEDCGYMARAAYLMDRVMSPVGLSGKSFIPLLSSYACAVPGIMAARVIEDRRDRLATILIAPLMSCSARLPVYVILIGAFVPEREYLGGLLGLQGLTLLAMYAVGTVTAIGVAWLLRRTLLKGTAPPFVMELPSYKLPSLRTVVYRMADRGWAFVRRAGTIIFAVTIVIWALAYYPRADARVEAEAAAQRAEMVQRLAAAPAGSPEFAAAEAELAAFEDPDQQENLRAGLHQRYSYLGMAGQWVEPVVRPLGWDWRIGCAAIASFPAREVVMGVLGVIYHLGGDVDVGDTGDQNRLQSQLQAAVWDDTGEPVYNLPVALSIMVFFALCAQCAATLAVIKRETNTWRWPIFTFVYMTLLAYVGALLTYQIGIRLIG